MTGLRGERGSGAAGRGVIPGEARDDTAGANAGPLTCLRCGFEVPSRAFGCRNPCANCGTIYPLGDCSD